MRKRLIDLCVCVCFPLYFSARLSVKKKGAAAVGKKTAKKEKAVKDPNKPKRPASAFFVFMY